MEPCLLWLPRRASVQPVPRKMTGGGEPGKSTVSQGNGGSSPPGSTADHLKGDAGGSFPVATNPLPSAARIPGHLWPLHFPAATGRDTRTPNIRPRG